MQTLTVCLLYEMGKGRTSWWHPYLMNLPHSYDNIATFGEFEKQALQVQHFMYIMHPYVICFLGYDLGVCVRNLLICLLGG